MPRLYGNTPKDELRRQLREASNDLDKERREHRETSRSLELARANGAVLARRIQSIEGKLKDLLAEASQEVSGHALVEEMKRRRQAEFNAILADANALADAPNA
jgi:sugar-specific transcriptional regulator TrmB